MTGRHRVVEDDGKVKVFLEYQPAPKTSWRRDVAVRGHGVSIYMALGDLGRKAEKFGAARENAIRSLKK